MNENICVALTTQSGAIIILRRLRMGSKLTIVMIPSNLVV